MGATKDALQWPGATEDFLTIDGTDLQLATEIESLIERLETEVRAVNGKPTLFKGLGTAGNGLPDFSLRQEFRLPYEFMSDADRRFLTKLGIAGGFHTLSLWKPFYLRFTAAAGQTMLYLPFGRLDAPNALARLQASYPFEFEVAGVPRTVSFAATVTESTVVANGNVTVSLSVDSSNRVAMKTAPALTVGQLVEIYYVPLLQVFVKNFSRNQPIGAKEPFEFLLSE